MSRARLFLLTTLSMVAFAGNSLLCRAALNSGRIDAASFTSIRIVAGAVTLLIIVTMRGGKRESAGNWISAFALFAYAAAFSFAYVSLTAATGALLLFGAVQATMIGTGLSKGERLHGLQIVGLICALGGLVGLLLPGLSAPSLHGSALMLVAGVAWGVYSLRGRSSASGGGGSGSDPLRVTQGNFLRAVVFAVMLSLGTFSWVTMDAYGVALAIASGALASGIGYVIWYAALRRLKAVTAATVQLSVPVIAAIGGVTLLGEPPTLRLLMAAIAILGGIALVIVRKQ